MAGLVLIAAGCRDVHLSSAPSIAFTRLPRSDDGGTEIRDVVEGRAEGARPGERVVLFAKSGTGVWWVQPFADQPYTSLEANQQWHNSTHLGTEYAALLVDASYRPPQTAERLPEKGGPIRAIAVAKGQVVGRPVSRTLHFSGYEWEIRAVPSNRGGANNSYDPANAWTDASGRLHLRIARSSGKWTAAEVTLARSLGYGTYRFDVEDISRLEPAAVFGMFTWDESLADANHREFDAEISRWGDPAQKNAQYVIQPYYVPANVVRFALPDGPLSHSFQWTPGKISFRTARPSQGKAVAEHAFTSGVPLPGGEAIRINLYPFANQRSPLEHEAEVVIDRFEYLP